MRKENPDYLLILPWHFLNEFKEGEDIKYKDYFGFCYGYIDDLSEIMFIKCNWNDEYDYI